MPSEGSWWGRETGAMCIGIIVHTKLRPKLLHDTCSPGAARWQMTAGARGQPRVAALQHPNIAPASENGGGREVLSCVGAWVGTSRACLLVCIDSASALVTVLRVVGVPARSRNPTVDA